MKEHNESLLESSIEKILSKLTLIAMAMKDMRYRMTEPKPVFNTTRACLVLGIYKQNWHWDGWPEKLDTVEKYIDEIDKRALAPLVELIDEVCEK